MKIGIAIGLVLTLLSCKKECGSNEVAETVAPITAPIEIVDFDGYATLINENPDKTYVVNFWATWCKPCIKELPAFEKLNESYKGENVEVILVSLDFKNQIEAQLIPFIEKRNLKSRIVLMDDPRENEWLPKVNKNWSGAIPATVIKKGNKQNFYERSFNYDELEEALKDI